MQNVPVCTISNGLLSTEHQNAKIHWHYGWRFRPATVSSDRFHIHTLRSIPHSLPAHMQKYETSHTTRMEKDRVVANCGTIAVNINQTPIVVRLRVLWFYELCDICSRFFFVASIVTEWTAAAAAAVVPSFIYLVPVGCYFYRCLRWLMAVTQKFLR